MKQDQSSVETLKYQDRVGDLHISKNSFLLKIFDNNKPDAKVFNRVPTSFFSFAGKPGK
jgi:hypothetical protein